jgi:hypothetical protein
MTRLKTLGLVSLALLVFGVITASAFAENPLPDIHALETSEYPITISGEAKALGETEAAREKEFALFTETSKLPALAVKSTIEIKELTSLGKVTFNFTGVHEKREPTNTCRNAVGNAAGEVNFEGAFHLVFNLITPKLELAALLLFANFQIECTGGLKVNVEGPALVGVVPLPPASNGDITNIDVFSHCVNPASPNGTAEILSYFTNTEERKNVLVKSNLGGAPEEKSCEEVRDTALLGVASGSTKMFTILW